MPANRTAVAMAKGWPRPRRPSAPPRSLRPSSYAHTVMLVRTSVSARRRPHISRAISVASPKCARAYSCSSISSCTESACARSTISPCQCWQRSLGTNRRRAGFSSMEVGWPCRVIGAQRATPSIRDMASCATSTAGRIRISSSAMRARSMESFPFVPAVCRRCRELSVGTRVRILPNHACATGAQHDQYHVIRGSGEVVANWPRVRGW